MSSIQEFDYENLKHGELYFVTGNYNKRLEIEKILRDVSIKVIDIDVDEIQEIEVEKVIQKKIREVVGVIKRKGLRTRYVFCEDTGLYIKNANNFPGALIKWYLKCLGLEKIGKIHKNAEAYAETIIGFFDGINYYTFIGTCEGKIVESRGKGFGWDPIFLPNGKSQTFAEMPLSEKNKISHRNKAFMIFKEHLNENYLSLKAPIFLHSPGET